MVVSFGKAGGQLCCCWAGSYSSSLAASRGVVSVEGRFIVGVHSELLNCFVSQFVTGWPCAHEYVEPTCSPVEDNKVNYT